MNIHELVQRGGSKLEITRAIIEFGLDKEIPVPKSAWMYAGGSVDALWRAVASFPKPLIVRGSHPNDYHGFIDVIPTIRDVRNRHGLEAAIRIIETAMKQEDVKIHCEDWGQPYDPIAHILVQEQLDCESTGFMLRHPHTGSLSIEQKKQLGGPVSFVRLGEHFYYDGGHIFCQEELSDLYSAVESLPFLENEFVYQVECGLTKSAQPIFFQARPFKKREAPENFEVPKPVDAQSPYLYMQDFCEGCFGITPSEGVELEFTRNVHYMTETSSTKEFGLLIEKKIRKPSPIFARFGNMHVLINGVSFSDWQSHNNYRIVKRAKYTMLSMADRIEPFIPLPRENFHATYISNGREGILLPTQ